MTSSQHSPLNELIDEWRSAIMGPHEGLINLLDRRLADDVRFFSPVVFTPQEGKAITTAYLLGAASVLHDGFTYTKQAIEGRTAMLEFECTVDDRYVNGVDIITINDNAEIVEFRVMIRPLQAVNAVHQAMMAALDPSSRPPAAQPSARPH